MVDADNESREALATRELHLRLRDTSQKENLHCSMLAQVEGNANSQILGEEKDQYHVAKFV